MEMNNNQNTDVMGLIFKNDTANEQYNARLHHLANTFKLYKENKLKFFYPENDNRDYTDEEEEMLLRARIDSISVRKNYESHPVSKIYKELDIQEIEEGDLKLKVMENHNIYVDSLSREKIDAENNKMWGRAMFFALCESISKLLKKQS